MCALYILYISIRYKLLWKVVEEYLVFRLWRREVGV